MLALTLIRPWPMAFLWYGKRVENRGWWCPVTAFQDRIALHAGKKYDEQAARTIARIVTERDFGNYPESNRIAAYSSILDNLHREPYPPMSVFATAFVSDQQPYSHDNEFLTLDPFAFGPICWLTTDLVEVEPVECRGAQKLWKLPTDVEARLKPIRRIP